MIKIGVCLFWCEHTMTSQIVDPSTPYFVPPKKLQKIGMHVCHFTNFGLTKQKLLKFKLYSYLEISFLNDLFFTRTFEIKLNSTKIIWDGWFYTWDLIYLGQQHEDPLMLSEIMSKAKEQYLWNVNIIKWNCSIQQFTRNIFFHLAI